MKKCSTCGEVKSLGSFNVFRKAKDGRQARCRDCCKAWYVTNAARHKTAVSGRADLVRRRNREWVATYLLGQPCQDCGESDIRCLDFDHRPGAKKWKEIGKLVNECASITSIRQEIAKCDVVCANCHRRRTSERAGFWKEAVQRETQLSRSAAAAARLSSLFLGAAGQNS